MNLPTFPRLSLRRFSPRSPDGGVGIELTGTVLGRYLAGEVTMAPRLVRRVTTEVGSSYAQFVSFSTRRDSNGHRSFRMVVGPLEAMGFLVAAKGAL